ncbi:XRE family transcriptional regulator [Halobacillus fulvus]|nr:XRE family transcriptional regulator [Halobacillus fulvus]
MEHGFGDKLKKLREENAWSQDDLALKLNVSRQAVYKWETNKGYPDINNLIQISDLFDVKVDELIRNDEDLRDSIQIDEKESLEKLSDPGFYIGLVIMLIGLFLNHQLLMIIGLLTLVFLSDLITSMISLFK